MEMVGLTVWEMNLGFRPKDFKSVWGASSKRTARKKPVMGWKDPVINERKEGTAFSVQYLLLCYNYTHRTGGGAMGRRLLWILLVLLLGFIWDIPCRTEGFPGREPVGAPSGPEPMGDAAGHGVSQFLYHPETGPSNGIRRPGHGLGRAGWPELPGAAPGGHRGRGG